MTGISIRAATEHDWPQMWPFMRRIIAAGETFPYDRDLDEEAARRLWMLPPPAHVVVAVDDDRVLGTANVYANRGGPGAHVATASFMVDPDRSRRGTGRALGEHALDWARQHGFLAMQFNAVVETNSAAVALWQSLGLTIVGTVPEAFLHPDHGYVGLHVMHRFL